VVDVVADVGFSAFSLGQVVFGPEKERGENFGFFLLDVGGVFIPCGAGIGTISRGLRFADDALDATRIPRGSFVGKDAVRRAARAFGFAYTRLAS
jgi:hypothetical protein